MQTLLLFDIDGTLIRSQGLGMRTMHRAGVELFGEIFSFDGVHTAGGLDPLLFASAAERSGITLTDHHHSAFHDIYVRLLPQAIDAERGSLLVLPGVTELLQRLRGDIRCTLGLLSGNYTRSAHIKLLAAQIDPAWFPIHAFGDEGPDRPSLVPLAMRRYAAHAGQRIDASRVIVIGDTPKDIEAAHAHGARALAVATGPYTVCELQDSGADITLENLADTESVLRYLLVQETPSIAG